MPKSTKAFDQLTDFITKEYGVKKHKMSPDTRLEKNLGITGDDGVEFLDKFLDHFAIDYDKNRDWQLHFDSEGFSLINFAAIYDWLLGRKPDRRKIYDLTLGHLSQIIELGYWIDVPEK